MADQSSFGKPKCTQAYPDDEEMIAAETLLGISRKARVNVGKVAPATQVNAPLHAREMPSDVVFAATTLQAMSLHDNNLRFQSQAIQTANTTQPAMPDHPLEDHTPAPPAPQTNPGEEIDQLANAFSENLAIPHNYDGPNSRPRWTSEEDNELIAAWDKGTKNPVALRDVLTHARSVLEIQGRIQRLKQMDKLW
ncbi:hypothetical protein EJ04DRAFT_524320 [Polyplosphaeria fusca]|uniref:Myb-like domain-containing protein n=1 Tax=Polyplosphaeria fusca TaxID=682080 RepID=A0A9P4V2U0_9PLEO|nr:hypothetical protein EJ04DRAFT_524320 [Polyplosphaeria fusca]